MTTLEAIAAAQKALDSLQFGPSFPPVRFSLRLVPEQGAWRLTACSAYASNGGSFKPIHYAVEDENAAQS